MQSIHVDIVNALYYFCRRRPLFWKPRIHNALTWPYRIVFVSMRVETTFGGDFRLLFSGRLRVPTQTAETSTKSVRLFEDRNKRIFVIWIPTVYERFGPRHSDAYEKTFCYRVISYTLTLAENTSRIAVANNAYVQYNATRAR